MNSPDSFAEIENRASTGSPESVATDRESAEPQMADPAQPDRVLLEGPHSRLKELLLLFRAMRDLLRGFRALHFVGPCIAIFGSARLGESSPYYALAREMG